MMMKRNAVTDSELFHVATGLNNRARRLVAKYAQSRRQSTIMDFFMTVARRSATLTTRRRARLFKPVAT